MDKWDGSVDFCIFFKFEVQIFPFWSSGCNANIQKVQGTLGLLTLGSIISYFLLPPYLLFYFHTPTLKIYFMFGCLLSLHIFITLFPLLSNNGTFGLLPFAPFYFIIFFSHSYSKNCNFMFDCLLLPPFFLFFIFFLYPYSLLLSNVYKIPSHKH